MTPEERARADAITAAIAESVKNRRQAVIPGVSPEPVTAASRTFNYAVFFGIVFAVHVAGFFAYRHYSETKMRAEEQRSAEIQAEAIRMAQATADAARAEVERLKLEGARRMAPQIEYNVVTTQPPPRPQSRPQVSKQQVTPSSASVQQPAVVADRTAEHAVIALNYLRSKKSDTWRARATSTDPVPGWDGRYRTEFEIPRDSYAGTSSPTPRRFEVLTQERDGKIIGIDVTTKGY